MNSSCANNIKKNIVLIGMPGAGKTTIAKELSKRLNVEFCDTDQYIEKREGKTIAEIFEKGENHFRDIEALRVREVASNFPIIIATGGGVVKREENIKALKENGVIFFLNRPVESIVSDINIKDRPLLKDGAEKVYKLYDERYKLYKKFCDYEIENNEIEETIDKIISILIKEKIIKKRVVKIRNVSIGEGMPKICVPMVGRNESELIHEANLLKNLELDVVEWRSDFFCNVENLEEVKNALEKIREIIPDKPIIFTFRSAKEGGEKEVSKEFYFKLNEFIARTKLVDIIDVELFNDENSIRELVKVAHDNKIAVIISNHDFHRTPEKEEIISRIKKAANLGADIPKIAVMPTSSKDVLTLLDATRIATENYVTCPIITMSMGGKGVISRLSGELFGSSLTFGAGSKASAPGQVSVGELKKIIQLLHNNFQE